MELFPVTLRFLPAWLPAGVVAGLALVCCGCTQTDFPPEKAQGLVALHPIHLDAEEVMLTQTQVECGTQNDLWEPPAQQASNGVLSTFTALTVAHLNTQAKQLRFDDDVVLSEPGFRQPYVQVRGDFPAQLLDDPIIIHDDGQYAKRVEGKVSITINHLCFPDPLPIMGVRKGKFNQDALVTLHFSLDNEGWHFDNLIH
jgi:hypothetical protein